MARWDPGAADRLRQAALKLYAERGYEAVTVADIAEHAGLTRRSFFRYFPDKREVLFAGSERFAPALKSSIEGVSSELSPRAAVLLAFREIGTELVRQVSGSLERRAIIAGSPELQERERTKHADIARAVTEALIVRGLPTSSATVLGPVCADLFRSAFDRHVTGGRDAGEDLTFSACLDDAFSSLGAFMSD